MLFYPEKKDVSQIREAVENTFASHISNEDGVYVSTLLKDKHLGISRKLKGKKWINEQEVRERKKKILKRITHMDTMASIERMKSSD